MFPADRLNKAFVLAPMAGVLPEDFNTPASGLQPPGFQAPNFGLPKNIEAWGHLSQRGRAGFFADTGTNVVRLWADWNAIQLNGPTFNPVCLEALDSNIAAARRAGLTVILTSRGFPGWVTGYAARDRAGLWATVPDAGNLGDQSGDVPAFFARFDPGPGLNAAIRAFQAARDDQGAPNGTATNGSAKLQLRWPGDIADADLAGLGSQNKNRARIDLLAPGTPWYSWMTFLAFRYHPSRQFDTIAGAPPRVAGASIDVLEIVNEPNLECWPQVAKDNRRSQIAPRMTAEMMRRAVAIQLLVNAGAPTPLYFAAPATSDIWRATDKGKTPSAERFTSSYDRFLRRVAQTLGSSFVPGPTFIFSHHNYLDIEKPRRARPKPRRYATKTVNSAGWVTQFMLGRQVRVKNSAGRLVGFRWRGWPNPTAPALAITEGGARLKSTITRADQPERIRTAFRETRDGRYGGNIVLFSNFLTWKDAGSVITTSHVVDRVVTRGGTRLDVGLIANPSPQDEPTTAEYDQLHRPAYDTWKALKEKR